MGKRDILGRFEFFTEAAPRFKEALLENANLVKLPEGAYYFHEGDSCGQVAFVGEGRIRVYKTGEAGREITLYHVDPGESCLINISCLLSDTPCPASARTETAVEALVYPGGLFHRWMATEEPVRKWVFHLFATRMAGMMSLVEEISFKRMDQRLARYLADQFRKGGEDCRELASTHDRIASEMGTAREVVSRLLKEFERQGAIRLARGKIVLENRAGLRACAGD